MINQSDSDRLQRIRDAHDEKAIEESFREVTHPHYKIIFFGHKATCTHCGGVVKMLRHEISMQLLPRYCSCLQCGLPFEADLQGLSIKDFDALQWKQKGENEQN